MSMATPDQGSIPASAGEPDGHPIVPADNRVHPRERGGAGGLSRRSGDGEGPSPRARGSLRPVASHARSPGSIPASAGEPQRETR